MPYLIWLKTVIGVQAIQLKRARTEVMPIFLIEELLMGLDEVRSSLAHAVFALEDLKSDLSPELDHALHTPLQACLVPLQDRIKMLDALTEKLATTV
jgi:hypothetical protein